MTRLQDVNTTDLAAAIRLGCHVMQNVFNADDKPTSSYYGYYGYHR